MKNLAKSILSLILLLTSLDVFACVENPEGPQGDESMPLQDFMKRYLQDKSDLESEASSGEFGNLLQGFDPGGSCYSTEPSARSAKLSARSATTSGAEDIAGFIRRTMSLAEFLGRSKIPREVNFSGFKHHGKRIDAARIYLRTGPDDIRYRTYEVWKDAGGLDLERGETFQELNLFYYVGTLLSDDDEIREGYDNFLRTHPSAVDLSIGDNLRQGRSDRQIKDEFLTSFFQYILRPTESPRLRGATSLKRSSSFSSDAGDAFAPQGLPVGVSERIADDHVPPLVLQILLSFSHDSIGGNAYTGQRPPLSRGTGGHGRRKSFDFSRIPNLPSDSNRPPHKRQSSIDLLAQPSQAPARSYSGDLSYRASLETSADQIVSPGPSPRELIVSPRKAKFSPRIPPRPLASPRR